MTNIIIPYRTQCEDLHHVCECKTVTSVLRCVTCYDLQVQGSKKEGITTSHYEMVQLYPVTCISNWQLQRHKGIGLQFCVVNWFMCEYANTILICFRVSNEIELEYLLFMI